MEIQVSIDRVSKISQKGFLGPSLKENIGLPSVGISAARNAGVDVDDDGRMRCPDGSPGAGTFTDLQQSNCKVPNLSSKKTLLTPGVIEFKAGLFNTRTRLGRTGQAMGSLALPGDISKLKNPVRSAAGNLFTPGKPKLGPRLRAPQIFRCPAGYENGGRFAREGLSGCGRRLFTPEPGGARQAFASATEAARDAGKASRFRTQGGTPGDGNGRGIDVSNRVGDPVQVSRRVQIPESGKTDTGRRESSLNASVDVVRKSPAKRLLVRADGVALSPAVSLAMLAKQKDNKDMKGGTLVANAKKSKFGQEELSVLVNSSASAVKLVLPGKGVVTVAKNRNLTSAEKRAVSAAARANIDPSRIADITKASGGALTYALENVTGSKDDIRIRPATGGPSRMVPEWVYETYLKKSAVGREDRDIWVLVKDS